MGRFRLLALLSVVLSASSCAFLLDFDELQKGGAGGADAGPDGGAAGMSAGSGGQAGSSAGATAGGEGGAAGAAGVPLDQAASVVADALCTKLDECFGSAALELVFFDEECQTVETSVLENTTVANVTLSEQNGTLDYDPSALPGCIDAVATLDCEALSVSFPEECKQALGGLQQEGKACEHSLECEAGLYCNTQVCPGTCSKPLAADAPCTELDTCAPGLTCFQSACAALGKEGEACGGDVLPGCLTGLLCFGDDKSKMQTGKCFPAKDLFVGSEGQPCTFFGDTPLLCKTDNSCPLISFTPMCLARVASGGACQLAIPDMCPEGEYCNSGTCAPLPGAGEPCAGGVVLKPPCSAYMRCVSGTCRLLGDNGNTCAVAGECYSGVCDAGRCAAPLCQ